MICRKCNHEFMQTDNLYFCPKCGNEINEANYSETSNAVKNDTAYHVNPMLLSTWDSINGKSIKWFKFFTKYLMPIIVIGSIGSFLNETKEIILQNENSNLSIEIIFILLLNIVLLVLFIKSISPLKKLQKAGYILLNYFFKCSIILPAVIIITLIFLPTIRYSLSLSTVLSNDAFLNGLFLYIGSNLTRLIFIIPNMVYFHKRKDMFVN